MNRPIKFRAWDKEAKKMYKVQKILLGAAGEGAFSVDGIWFPHNETRVATMKEAMQVPEMPEISTMNICFDEEECKQSTPHCELMQFTGLLDKNGLEIYEGDIIRNHHGPNIYDFEVVFRWGVFGHAVSRTQQDPLHELGPEEYLEVIGNIYENPELIKKQ